MHARIRMCARTHSPYIYSCNTDLCVVWEPSVWWSIASQYFGTHEIGWARSNITFQGPNESRSGEAEGERWPVRGLRQRHRQGRRPRLCWPIHTRCLVACLGMPGKTYRQISGNHATFSVVYNIMITWTRNTVEQKQGSVPVTRDNNMWLGIDMTRYFASWI